jgi:hypothetical protein
MRLFLRWLTGVGRAGMLGMLVGIVLDYRGLRPGPLRKAPPGADDQQHWRQHHPGRSARAPLGAAEPLSHRQLPTNPIPSARTITLIQVVIFDFRAWL